MKKIVVGLAALALLASAPALSKPKSKKGGNLEPAEASTAPAETPAAETPAAENTAETPAASKFTAEEDVDPGLMAAISYRHAQMKLAGGHMKSIKAVVKGYEAGKDEVLVHAAALESIAAGLGNHWPAGSGHETNIEDMGAKAEIWTDAEGFAAEIAKFQEATTALHTAAKAGDMAGVGDALGAVGGSCGSCHDAYRD